MRRCGNSAERKESYGVNEFEYPPPKSFLELCNDALADVTVRILTRKHRRR